MGFTDARDARDQWHWMIIEIDYWALLHACPLRILGRFDPVRKGAMKRVLEFNSITGFSWTSDRGRERIDWCKMKWIIFFGLLGLFYKQYSEWILIVSRRMVVNLMIIFQMPFPARRPLVTQRLGSSTTLSVRTNMTSHTRIRTRQMCWVTLSSGPLTLMTMEC